MAFKVIDGEQGLVERGGDGLGGGETDEDAADEAWSGGRSNRVDVGQRDACLLECLGDDVVEPLDMGAGSELWHDAAKGRVLVELAAHHVGTNGALAGLIPHHDGGRGFIAAGLNAEDDGLRLPGHDELVYSVAQGSRDSRPKTVPWLY